MKKSFVIVAAIMLCILTGCSSVTQIIESEAMAAEMTSAETTSVIQEAVVTEQARDGADTSPAEAQETESSEADMPDPVSLTVDGYVGVCQYTVDSWSVYDSWADADISDDQLSSSNYPVGDAGIILVTITQYCESRNEMSLGSKTMIVSGCQPVAQSQIDGAKASNDYQKYLYIETDLAFPPSYLDQPGASEREYFNYPILNAGESATYTLGFVLSDTARAAAEDGTLLLWFTANGMPESVDGLLLLPLMMAK